MADKRSGPPSRGGPRSNTRSSSGRGGAPSRGGFGGSRDGGRGSDRPRSGGFSDRPKRDFGDRPQRSFDDRGPKRSFDDRPPRGDRPFNDRPKRDFGDRPRGGDRPFGDRPKRDFGDRPQRSFDDRPKRDFGDRPQRSFDDRPPRKDRDMPFEDRPRRSFQRDGFGASRKRDDMNTERPKRDFGDRPQRGERSFDDRPKRSFGGDRGPRPERREYSSDRAPRREGFEQRPQRDDKFSKPRHEFMEYAAHDALEEPKAPMKGHEMVIYGVHAVQAALRNPKRTVTHVWITDIGAAHLENAFDKARHPEPEVITRREIEHKLSPGAVHQGIAIAVEPLEEVYLSDILTAANAANADRQIVVVLDEVTDPHNVGAIMRSMSMFGAKALVVHKRNAPPITGVMAKTATGAVEHIPMVPVTNLAKALEELQMAGFYCLGLDEDATITIDQVPKKEHIALVLGAEGEGLRAKTRTTCNAIASIPSLGEIKSLNVSNAAAITLFSITRK